MMNILSENTGNFDKDQQEELEEVTTSVEKEPELDQEMFVSPAAMLQLKKTKFGGYAIKSVNDYIMRLQTEQRQVKEQMEKQIEGLLAEKRGVTQECDFLHDRIKECESSLQSAKAQMKTMFTQEQMDEVKAKLSLAETSLDQANVELQVLEETRNERDRLQTLCDENSSMIRQLESSYSKSIQEQDRLSKEIHVMEVALKGSREDIAEQIQSVLSENHQLDVDNCELRAKINTYDSTVPVTVAEREAFDQSVQELESERASLEAKREELNQQQQNIDQDIRTINDKIDELENREASIQQTEQELQDREILLNETKKNLAEKENRLREMENRVEQREGQIQLAVQSLTEKGIELEKQETGLQEREIQIQTTESDLAQRESSLSEAEASVAEKQTALDVVETALTQREAELRQAEALVSEKEAQILSAQNDVAEREIAVQQQTDSLVERETKVQEHENELNQRNESITKLEESLNERASSLQNAESAVSQREAMVESSERTLSEREERLREAEAALLQREATVQELEDAMSQKLLELHETAEENDAVERQLAESLEGLQVSPSAESSGNPLSIESDLFESSNPAPAHNGENHAPQGYNAGTIDQQSVHANLSSMYDALSQMMESLEQKSANMERMMNEQRSLRYENAERESRADRGRISELEAENQRLMKELQNAMSSRNSKPQPASTTVHVEPAQVANSEPAETETPVQQTPDALARARMILQKMKEDLSE